MSPIRLLIVLPALALAAAPAAAHHSFAAEFDPSSRGEVAGTITRVQFTNPHVRYRIEAERDGATEEWELQMSSVTTLRGLGWNEDTLKVGDRVTASGQLGRNGAHKLFARSVVTSDGRDLFTARESRADPNEVTADPDKDYGYGTVQSDYPVDITGPWRNSYKFRVTVDDLEPKPTPFTAEGRRIFEQTTHYDDYALRCLPLGLPRMFGSPYDMEIVDAGTHYVFLYLQNNAHRRIYMDGRSAPANQPPTSLGFSVGHWEDDTLVVETTHLAPGWLDGSGLPMAGEGTRIVERYDVSDDRLSIDRTMTIHDPYYTEPLVRRRGSARDDDVRLIEQDPCDPSGYYRDLLEAGELEERLR
ncbi:MAG: hypothetical protein JXB36_12065 [Gammaproteobacteria bacterium]|nr:hypothetical protein [Gammaproteobacteria bacterium]